MESISLSKQTYINDGRIRVNCHLPKTVPLALFIRIKRNESLLKDFIIARSSSKCVVNIKTKNAPDHKAIKLSLELSEKRRGPGLWKFNNALVDVH